MEHAPRDPQQVASTSTSGSVTVPIKKPRRRPLLSKAKSCINCRKAKLRCDRSWPCNNCLKRGIEGGCPGFVPRQRRDLGEATQAPTRNGGLASTNVPISTIDQTARYGAPASAGYDLVGDDDAFPDGFDEPTRASGVPRRAEAVREPTEQEPRRAQYYGRSAHSSYLAGVMSPPTVTRPNSGQNTPSRGRPSLPTPVLPESERDGQADPPHNGHQEEEPDAQTLSDGYHRHIAWMYCPVEERQLHALFHGDSRQDTTRGNDRAALRKTIATIYSAWTTTQSNMSSWYVQRIRNQAYRQCWNALDAARWSQSNSLHIQQAFFLLCLFLLNFQGGQMSDRFSSIFGICVAKAIESGLYTAPHTGAGQDDEVQRQRQRLFWELYTLDAFRSLAYCRPCFFQDPSIGVPKPIVRTDDDLFHAIKYENAQIINRFMTHHLHTAPTNFHETMELDLQIRKLFERIPAHLRVRNASRLSGGGARQSTRQVLQSCTVALNIHQTLLTLYRPWFVSTTMAEVQGKEDRQSVPYQRAQTCIGESASAMVDLCCRAYAVDPQTTMHWALFLHHAFNAGVCRAMQGIYGHPSDPLHFSAVDDVEEAIALLEKTRDHACGEYWLPRAHVLKKLRQRIDSVHNGQGHAGEGERLRRASNFSLLGATVPAETDRTEGSAMVGTVGLAGAGISPHTVMSDVDVTTAMTDETGSASGWLDLLNTDAFTLSMADLWNAENAFTMEPTAPLTSSTPVTWGSTMLM